MIPYILQRERGFTFYWAHGGDAKHIPMNIKSIAASGFDYIALGHIHKPQILIRDNAAYAGALEPVDRNDLGDHGYIEGHLENGSLRQILFLLPAVPMSRFF